MYFANINKIAIFLATFLMTLLPKLIAQEVFSPSQSQQQALTKAELYLQSFKNDSTMAITKKLMDELNASKQIDTDFGLRVQLAEAIAMENDEEGELAIAKLLHVIAMSDKKNMVDVVAKAHLSLALLYEKNGLKEKSLQHLRQSKVLIKQNALDAIYPYSAIRMSSWQRIYADKDSAIFFAKEALRTAPQQGLDLEEAIGHMLMNMLLPKTAFEERLQHCTKAVRIYEKIEDYTGCSYMYGAIAGIYFENGMFNKALIYNDSALIAAHRSIAYGYEKHRTIGNLYRFRGETYQKIGQFDSAFFYLDKGYETELKTIEENNRLKIMEIDARYDTEKQQLEIDTQKSQLSNRSKQLAFVFVFFILIMLLAIALYIALNKQQRIKQELSVQNALIRQQSEQLKSLDIAKSRFFANVSHELRTPLTLILGTVQLLLKENRLTEKQHELLQTAHRSAKQLLQLVNEILDLRKLDMNKMLVAEKPTQLRTYFLSYITQFESLALRKQIDFSTALSITDEVVASIDQEKCRQILFNLLSNAFKFTPAGGKINITIALANEQLILTVSDTGIGIHPYDLPYIFNRYYQTSQPHKPLDGGTGIGLALCHEYVQLFGGTIEVQSKLGTNTLFEVKFPVKLVAADIIDEIAITPQESMALSETEILPIAADIDNTHKPTILVVEDNLDIQRYIQLILQDKYHTITAVNGQEALHLLAHHHCQLILSDLMMPVMDGYQLLEKLKSDEATHHIPVILLTARGEMQDKLGALRIGVNDYLTKPFDEEELIARIENLLRNQIERQKELTATPTDDHKQQAVMSQHDAEWLANFDAYVKKHFSKDILTVTYLADVFAMSESSLLRRLKKLTGLSPLQYIQEVRLYEAWQLLENGTYNSVAQVAYKVGYTDARSFTRIFKQRFGKLPSAMLKD